MDFLVPTEIKGQYQLNIGTQPFEKISIFFLSRKDFMNKQKKLKKTTTMAKTRQLQEVDDILLVTQGLLLNNAAYMPMHWQ